MSNLTPKHRQLLRQGILVVSVLVFTLCAVVLLWESNRSTPGDPVGLYRRLVDDGLEANGEYIQQDQKDYPRQVLILDLSESLLTPEEKEELLRLVEEDWPMLEAIDFPAEASGYTLHGRDNDDGREYLLNGETFVKDGSVQLYYLSLKFADGLPFRETLGTEEVVVHLLMEMGGYQGRRVSYIHHPRRGWVVAERGPVMAHS